MQSNPFLDTANINDIKAGTKLATRFLDKSLKTQQFLNYKSSTGWLISGMNGEPTPLSSMELVMDINPSNVFVGWKAFVPKTNSYSDKEQMKVMHVIAPVNRQEILPTPEELVIGDPTTEWQQIMSATFSSLDKTLNLKYEATNKTQIRMLADIYETTVDVLESDGRVVVFRLGQTASDLKNDDGATINLVSHEFTGSVDVHLEDYEPFDDADGEQS